MTSKAVDVLKDLFTYGTAAFVIAFGMVEVADLVRAGEIDGATAIAFYTTLAAAAVAFLFGVALGRSQTRAYERGLLTPTPGSEATVVTGDNPTVQSGGPTTVTNP